MITATRKPYGTEVHFRGRHIATIYPRYHRAVLFFGCVFAFGAGRQNYGHSYYGLMVNGCSRWRGVRTLYWL